MPNALNFKDFEERLANSASVGPTEVQFIAADAGGIDLAYEVFTPPGNFSDLLVFYHGGGSNMHAGYDRLASELASRAPLAVCLPDMRGHGASGGRRGHADTPTDVWKDVDCLVARLARDFRVRIHLGGHSSAAGMLVNYCILHTPQTNVSSLILLAPEFGFRAGLYRAGTGPSGAFARIKICPFLLNSFSAGHLGGSIPAVTLNYEASQLGPEMGIVQNYTVNMATAVTPKDPIGQLARLELPTWLIP